MDDLPCESLKQVREIFRILKHSYRGAKTELEDARLAKGPSDTAVAAGAGGSCGRRHSCGRRGRGTPDGTRAARGRRGGCGDAEGEVGDMDAEGSTFNVGVAPPI